MTVMHTNIPALQHHHESPMSMDRHTFLLLNLESDKAGGGYQWRGSKDCHVGRITPIESSLQYLYHPISLNSSRSNKIILHGNKYFNCFQN